MLSMYKNAMDSYMGRFNRCGNRAKSWRANMPPRLVLYYGEVFIVYELPPQTYSMRRHVPNKG